MVVDLSLDAALETVVVVVTVFCVASTVDDVVFIVSIDDGVEKTIAFDVNIPNIEECVGFKDFMGVIVKISVDAASDGEEDIFKVGVVGSGGANVFVVVRDDGVVVVVVFGVLFVDDINDDFVNRV